MTSKKIDIGYSPAGRSVLGKTVHKVLETQDTWVLKTEGIVFPLRTDLARLVNNILIFFYNRAKSMQNTRVAVIMARFATNHTISSEQIEIKTDAIQVEETSFTERFLFT